MAVVNKELIENYKAIHKSKKYGQNANDFMLHCLVCIFDLNAKKVLEYGCGQSVLYKKFENFGIEWQRFDPSIEGIDILPSGQDFDLCVNTDVLEHIPEEDIGDVLKKIKSYSEKVFFSISTRPARQILSNGQNAHCTVWKAEKWLRKIKDFFPESILVNNRFDEEFGEVNPLKPE